MLTARCKMPITDYSYEEIFFTVAGIGGAAAHNVFNKRPAVAGIHKLAIGAVSGFFLGKLIYKDRMRRNRERMIYMEDYVRQHPEDFIEPSPVYYRDVFKPWIPIR